MTESLQIRQSVQKRSGFFGKKNKGGKGSRKIPETFPALIPTGSEGTLS